MKAPEEGNAHWVLTHRRLGSTGGGGMAQRGEYDPPPTVLVADDSPEVVLATVELLER